MSRPNNATRARPDGGWGWMVVLGATIFMFVIPGINRSFSLILESWRVRFSASAAATSWTFAIYSIVSAISGPVCSMLTARLGVRLVVILGALLVTVGLLGSAFAANLYVIYFTFGGLMGLGRGLIDVAKEVAFNEWFDKHRSKASGFSALSSGIGTMAMSPLIQVCIEEYGSSGALIILAGLGFHLLISGFLTRSPYPWEIQRDQVTSKDSKLTTDDDVDTDNQYTIISGTTATQTEKYRTLEERHVGANKDATCQQQNYIADYGLNVPKGAARLHDNCHESDVREGHNEYNNNTSSYCSLHLYRNPQFAAYSLLTASGQGSNSLMFAYFAGLTSERGISLRHSSYLLALTGVFIILARFTSSILFDITAIRRYRRETMGVLATIMGLSMVGFSLIVSNPGFLSCWVVYVCSQAVFGVQYGAVLTDIIGPEDYLIAIGLLRFVWCFGYIVGPSVGGYLKDSTGVYDYTFLYGGLMTILPAIIYFAVMLSDRWGTRRRAPKGGTSNSRNAVRDESVEARDGSVEARDEICRSPTITTQPCYNTILHALSSTRTSKTRAVPDGGWGWMVVLGGAIILFVVPGITRSFSLILESWRVRFSASAAAASWAFSIYSIVATSCGPVCSMLTARLGVRLVVILGALLVTVGLFGSAFAPNLYVIYCTFGGIVGFGRGLVSFAREVAFSEWFDKHRSKASGFSALSSGIGTMAMAPLIQVCIEEYGSSGAMIILAGLGFHILIAGLLSRSPHISEIKRDQVISNQLTPEGKSVDTMDQYSTISSKTATPADKCRIKKESHNNANTDGTIERESYIFELKDNENNDASSGGILHKPEVNEKRCLPCWNTVSTCCNFHLYRNPQFVAFSLITATGQTSSSLMFAYFAGLTSERGISLRHSSYLLALTGVFIILARFISSILFDITAIRRYRREVMDVLFTIMGLSMVGFSLIVSNPDFLACWVVYVSSQSVFSIQYGAVLTDIIGPDDYATALGQLRFVWCFGYIVGPSVGGYLKHVTGVYDYSFLYGGLITILPAIIYFVVMYTYRTKGRVIKI